MSSRWPPEHADVSGGLPHALMTYGSDVLQRLTELNAIGIALSRQRNVDALLESILEAAQRLTRADAGTLYLYDKDQQLLRFALVRNHSLQLSMGGASGIPVDLDPIPLHDERGEPNHAMVVSHAVLARATVNIPDAYQALGFDFSGTKRFDARIGYRSQSFLTVPMHDHEDTTIGVLQLINARGADGSICAFSRDDQQLLESLASQAAIALTNRQLINQLEALFEAFIQLINNAIDEKSAYTGAHCARVPVLTMMLAEAASRTAAGPLKDFTMTEADRHELRIAGLLHDCGKITTPVHIVDKGTKLETLFDRIQLIDARFDVLRRDAEIAMLHALLAAGADTSRAAQAQREYGMRLAQYADDQTFLRRCNIGGEKMADTDQSRVRAIAAYRWRDSDGNERAFLSADEVENLTIPSGTLTAAERQVINQHIVTTIRMLESLPWPRHLKNVPEYAGGHHERMDGKGYPRGLTREQLSIQARVMGIADIFEALTAKDRPYKQGKTLTEALTILGNLKLAGHIDPDLFDVFIREKVYLEYARQFLAPEQVDAVDLTRIPGCSPVRR